MSNDQKGFIVYGDIKPVVDRLSDEEAGQLLRGMLDYFLTGKEPKFQGVLEFVFIPIKQQMDRNADKYEQRCEKNRENIKKRWSKDTTVYDRIRTYTNDTNTNTNTDTNTKTDTDTTTTTDTKARGSGADDDDSFNIWNRMTVEDVDAVYNEYPESGGLLIDAVYSDVKAKKKRVRDPVPYILGYAKRVGWDDAAQSGGDANV